MGKRLVLTTTKCMTLKMENLTPGTRGVVVSQKSAKMKPFVDVTHSLYVFMMRACLMDNKVLDNELLYAHTATGGRWTCISIRCESTWCG